MILYLKLKLKDFKFEYRSCGGLECVFLLGLSFIYLMSVQSCA